MHGCTSRTGCYGPVYIKLHGLFSLGFICRVGGFRTLTSLRGWGFFSQDHTHFVAVNHAHFLLFNEQKGPKDPPPPGSATDMHPCHYTVPLSPPLQTIPPHYLRPHLYNLRSTPGGYHLRPRSNNSSWIICEFHWLRHFWPFICKITWPLYCLPIEIMWCTLSYLSHTVVVKCHYMLAFLTSFTPILVNQEPWEFVSQAHTKFQGCTYS